MRKYMIIALALMTALTMSACRSNMNESRDYHDKRSKLEKNKYNMISLICGT